MHPLSLADDGLPLSGAPRSQISVDFDAVYAAHFPFVWRCLQSLGVPPSGLDDAVQDVFLVVHRQLRHFEGKSSLRTWLYGIARKVAFNHRRRLQRKGHTEALDEQAASPDGGPHDRAQDSQAAQFVREFLERLPEQRREVFLLAAVEQWSAPEVAEALNVPLNTVYSRLRVAREEFKAALAKRKEAP